MNKAKNKKLTRTDLFCFLSYFLFLLHNVLLTYWVLHAVVLRNSALSCQVWSIHQSGRTEQRRIQNSFNEALQCQMKAVINSMLPKCLYCILKALEECYWICFSPILQHSSHSDNEILPSLTWVERGSLQ